MSLNWHSKQGGERDLVLLQHLVTVREADGKRLEHTVTLVEYGKPGGYSAMALTVGVPTALAADLILKGPYQIAMTKSCGAHSPRAGIIHRRGVIAPMDKSEYQPLLEMLTQQGIHCREESREC
jgi:saccharopine dehydrogenase (NADP+, L-glutamate forming)